MKKLNLHEITKFTKGTTTIIIMAVIALCMISVDVAAQSTYDLARRQGEIKITPITRADLMNMSVNQLREALTNLDFYQITDLVNATSAHLSQRMENLIYLDVDQFNQSDVERKMHMLQNPGSYIIVSNSSAIPKATISRTQLNSLAPEKRQALLDSGNFTIVD